jgi:hypothetical protein
MHAALTSSIFRMDFPRLGDGSTPKRDSGFPLQDKKRIVTRCTCYWRYCGYNYPGCDMVHWNLSIAYSTSVVTDPLVLV